MIYFITGPVNSGKSTYLLSIYNTTKKGGGFYLKKEFLDSVYIGQEIICLQTDKKLPFSRIACHIPENWDEAYRYKYYSFSYSAMMFAEDIFKHDFSPSYIDELGPLELNNKGFYNIFCNLLSKDTDIYAVCRYECLWDIINKFDIMSYRIL